jgi:alkylated DNA repair dioxygenase AlkB
MSRQSHSHPQARTLAMSDAEVVFYPNFFNQEESNGLFDELANSIAWQQQTIKLYARTLKLPRLTAWYGDEGKYYTYSGITANPRAWTPTLWQIKQRIEPLSGVIFNSVLLNYYRSKRDSVSWHSDDEPELGTNPVIGSVSFGATRRFQLKHKENPDQKETVELTHGSLLLMSGPTQHYWLHQIPKSTKCSVGRINLTFRIIQ